MLSMQQVAKTIRVSLRPAISSRNGARDTHISGADAEVFFWLSTRGEGVRLTHPHHNIYADAWTPSTAALSA